MTEDVPRSPTPVLLQDFEAAKARQDRSLDTIDKGLTTLRGIGEAMGETLRQQDVVLDAIHERVRLHPRGAWDDDVRQSVRGEAACAVHAQWCTAHALLKLLLWLAVLHDMSCTNRHVHLQRTPRPSACRMADISTCL